MERPKTAQGGRQEVTWAGAGVLSEQASPKAVRMGTDRWKTEKLANALHVWPKFVKRLSGRAVVQSGPCTGQVGGMLVLTDAEKWVGLREAGSGA